LCHPIAVHFAEQLTVFNIWDQEVELIMQPCSLKFVMVTVTLSKMGLINLLCA